MINPKDLHTFHTVQPLVVTNPTTQVKTTVGTTIISYEIRRYRDLRNLADTPAYQVLCTQRIVIPNINGYTPGSDDIQIFDNYPAVVSNQVSMSGEPSGSSPELVTYSPRTVNSSVMTSVSSGQGDNASATIQHTSGSSTSQSNSFGASASIGMFGELPTASFSTSYDHTHSSERSKSASSASASGHSSQESSGDSMTVKDWACYTSLDPDDSTVTWIWGQEYPWNVLQYRNNNNTASIVLPNFVNPLLYDGTQLLPPSQLSQFGLDFTMKAAWIVQSTESLSLTHQIQYFTATHQLNGTSVSAAINAPISFTVTTPALDLCAYGLDPIHAGSSVNTAIIGFIPRRFLVAPAPAQATAGQITLPTPFTIISVSNNLLIRDTTDYTGLQATDAGAGFSASATALIATVTANCKSPATPNPKSPVTPKSPSLQMTLTFKVNDAESGYRLYLKHWKSTATCVVLTIVINGDAENAIVKHVDALEAEGGENNLLSISLRNLNYGSVDFHDYLQLGLNTIDIRVAPDGDATECGYQVRAVSIERE